MNPIRRGPATDNWVIYADDGRILDTGDKIKASMIGRYFMGASAPFYPVKIVIQTEQGFQLTYSLDASKDVVNPPKPIV